MSRRVSGRFVVPVKGGETRETAVGNFLAGLRDRPWEEIARDPVAAGALSDPVALGTFPARRAAWALAKSQRDGEANAVAYDARLLIDGDFVRNPHLFASKRDRGGNEVGLFDASRIPLEERALERLKLQVNEMEATGDLGRKTEPREVEDAASADASPWIHPQYRYEYELHHLLSTPLDGGFDFGSSWNRDRILFGLCKFRRGRYPDGTDEILAPFRTLQFLRKLVGAFGDRAVEYVLSILDGEYRCLGFNKRNRIPLEYGTEVGSLLPILWKTFVSLNALAVDMAKRSNYSLPPLRKRSVQEVIPFTFGPEFIVENLSFNLVPRRYNQFYEAVASIIVSSCRTNPAAFCDYLRECVVASDLKWGGKSYGHLLYRSAFAELCSEASAAPGLERAVYNTLALVGSVAQADGNIVLILRLLLEERDGGRVWSDEMVVRALDTYLEAVLNPSSATSTSETGERAYLDHVYTILQLEKFARMGSRHAVSALPLFVENPLNIRMTLEIVEGRDNASVRHSLRSGALEAVMRTRILTAARKREYGAGEQKFYDMIADSNARADENARRLLNWFDLGDAGGAGR